MNKSIQDTESQSGFMDTLKLHINDYINNPELMLDIVTQIIIAGLIFWIGKKLAGLLSRLFAKALEKSQADLILVSFVKNLSYFLMLMVVIVTSLSQLGVNTGSLLGMVAAAGLAIGLALKDSLSNFASGVMIVIFKPIKLGDYVEVAGLTGTVKEIRIFSTILNTSDNKMIIIPNGLVTSDPIVNYTNQETRRVALAIGVSYDDDLKKVKKILLQTASSHALVLKDPAPGLLLTDLGESSVNFSVRVWTKTEDYWTVHSDLLQSMKENLEEAGCSLPYPQRDVHVHNIPK